MKRLFFLIIVGSLLVITQTFAQEVCNNGFDDDNDGFIDCYDKDCYNNVICKDFFIGKDAACNVKPDTFPPFEMKIKFTSPANTANHVNRLIVGDVDQDGIPELVTTYRNGDNGGNGTTISNINVLQAPVSGTVLNVDKQIDMFADGFNASFEDIAMADIDKDGCAEYFILTTFSDGVNYRVIAYNCKGVKIWAAPIDFRFIPGLAGTYPSVSYPGTMGLVDFDGDGKVELYFRAMIFDAQTGVLMGSYNVDDDETNVPNKGVNKGWGMTSNAPIAADIDPTSPGLELIAGCRVYGVSINRGAMTATLTPIKQRAEYATRTGRTSGSGTSVADFNQDGYLDVLAVGSNGGYDQNTTIFFWDYHNDQLKTYMPAGGGWQNGAGRINIADIDGDTLMNAVYVSGSTLYALKETPTALDILWTQPVTENTSGYTGCTMFDFNADGKSEIVYRDEDYIYIYTTTNIAGVVNVTRSTGITCKSRTSNEYPIVADMDGDGSTEICVTCAIDETVLGRSHALFDAAEVRVYQSANEPWVPARRVWNQHGYFIVNVNDDLTIPLHQQLSEKVFANHAPCKNGGRNRPFNSFLNQAPFTNSVGCPQYAAPNLTPLANTLTVNQPTCPDTDFTISFNIQNTGNMAVSGSLPISFYDHNPMKSGGKKFNTVTITLPKLGPDDIYSVVNATVKGNGSPDSLFIVINDSGIPGTTPIVLPNTKIIECDYDNVFSTYVKPKTVPVVALPLKDNIKCVGSTSPNNGAVHAYVSLAGGVKDSTNFNFYWSIGATAKAKPADFSGSIYSGLLEGTYTVYAVHKTASCSSDTAKTTIGRVDKAVNVTISLDNPYNNCKVPNGKLRAIVNGGDPVANYTFEWYQGNDIFGVQVGVGDVVSGLGPVTYTVLAKDKTTGCPGLGTFTVPDNTVKPVVTATAVNITCSGAANSGSASANVGGVTSGFTFKWYKGNAVKPSPDFTGAVYSSLVIGNYTVVASNTTTQCDSDPVTVSITQTTKPVITAAVVSDQTSCDPSQPIGSASANVGGVTTPNYTFEWFKGQNTLPANSVATTSTASNLVPSIYTVKVTDAATGCFDTKEVTIKFAAVTPTLILAAIGDMTNCTTPNGSVSVNVSVDTPSDYTFSWYNGTAVKATPDYPETSNTLSNLPVGTYTVKAVHNTKHCTTAPISAKVKDATPVINIVLDATVTKSPSDCTSPSGIMKVDVSATGNVSGFNIKWYFGNAPFVSPVQEDNGVTSSTASGLFTGVYTVVATNLDNGCVSSKVFYLPFANGQKLEFVNKIDVDRCSPQNIGSISVKLTAANLVGLTEADNDILVYEGVDDSGPLKETIHGVAGVQTYTTSSDLTPGPYTIIAVSTNSLILGCKSTPVDTTIVLSTKNPSITSAQVDANTNCPGAIVTANGKITLTLKNPPSNDPNDFNFNWFTGTDLTGTPLSGAMLGGTNGEVAQNLLPGFYTVQIVKKLGTGANSGCDTTATYQVFDNPPIVSIASADITVTDVTLCGALNGGGAVINFVEENGVQVPVGGYTFAWYDASQTQIGTATNTITNLTAGTYYVVATSTANNCATTQLQFEIKDKTLNTVGVDLTSFVDPTRCLKPTNINGTLTVNGTGTSTLGYSYAWYAGSTATLPVVSTNPNFTGITVPLGQPDITYTIQVTNISNGCSITDTYKLPVDIAPITITASAAPLTSCSFADGASFAVVTSGVNTDYNYNWYFGNAVKATPDSVKKQMVHLPAGNYTVVAVDITDSFCQTAPLTVTVEDDLVFPIVTAIPTAPMASCDPSKADGIATATVGGNVIDYNFNWYTGMAASGSPFYTGTQANNLNAGTYTVVAINAVSGCSDSTTIAIKNQPKTIDPPQVVVLSDVTSCDPNNPDGSLTAVVTGNPSEYSYTWTKTDDASFTPRTSEIIDNLNAGPYKLVIQELSSLCVAQSTGTININQKFPAIDFTVVNATCNVYMEGGGSSGQPTGAIAIYVTNGVEIKSIQWYQTGSSTEIGSGPILTSIDAGKYDVTVTSSQACPATKTIEVKTDIHPFNGISRNGDGKNETFWINCIDNFPSNNVKIYNRAGTLVYEASNYNNSDIVFDGRSNRGVSPMGTNLPDGTYFYIIDKHDGSKQLAGYLEIVN